MAAVETIREYLVALGYSIDEAGWRKFESGVLRATEPVLKLGAAVTATAAAVEVMVESVARQMEDLFYASQRTNAAAASLQAVGFAARQVGLEAGQGTDLLEGLGRAMRMNPGTEGLINQLGVQTRDASGHLLEMGGVLDEILKRLATMPRFQALRYGQLLGFDPEALNQVLNNLPRFLKAQEDARQSLKKFGLDLGDAAKKGQALSNAFHVLERDLGNLGTRIATDLTDPTIKAVKALDSLIVKIGEVNNATGGKAGEAGVVGGAIAGSGLIGWLLKKFGFTTLGSIAGAPAAGAGFLLRRLFGPLGILLGSTSETNTGEQDYIRAHPELYPYAQPGSGSLPLGIRSNNPGNIRPGGHEAQFPTPLAGLSALAGTLLRYAEHGRDTLQQIVEKYAPAADGNNVAAYVTDLARRTGFGAGQHLNLQDPATLERVMRAIVIHENGDNPYSHELLAAAIAGRLGTGTNVNLTQKTEINVTGASDPAATGRRVGDEQSRVNGDLARNLAAIVR